MKMASCRRRLLSSAVASAMLFASEDLDVDVPDETEEELHEELQPTGNDDTEPMSMMNTGTVNEMQDEPIHYEELQPVVTNVSDETNEPMLNTGTANGMQNENESLFTERNVNTFYANELLNHEERQPIVSDVTEPLMNTGTANGTQDRNESRITERNVNTLYANEPINREELQHIVSDDTEPVMNDGAANGTQDENESPHTERPKLTRKRKRDPSQWKKTIAKNQRQAGLEYCSLKSGKTVPSKVVKTVKDCSTNCKFQCANNISEEERSNINKKFWSLNDEAKCHFYSEYTQRKETERSRAVTNEKPKAYSYRYFFRCGDSSRLEQVCKTYFLSTLDISQRRIYYFYENMRCVETGVPRPPASGKNVKNKIADSEVEEVRNHINLFPRIPSHYCRSSSNKEYLEKALNLSKMYVMYLDYCAEKEIAPVKQHKYREIFNTGFNIGFLAPKKDRCDKCELLKMNPDLSEKEKQDIEEHVQRQRETRNEREVDRNAKTKGVLCFDLENVFSLPISGVSNFFYKRKLSTFNMTGTFSITKKAYFAVWHEGTGGRTGNNMASAIIKILDQVVEDHPTLTELTLWSDSCVSQNKNSVMTNALMIFIKKHPHITSITQKFCEAGHSSIQEVDNVHSIIERHLRHREIFSPLGLVKSLTTIKNCQVIQMSDFFDYQASAKSQFCFSRVPFTMVRQLRISQVMGTVNYKLSHKASEWTTVSVRKDTVSTRKGKGSAPITPTPIKVLKKTEISGDKKKDLTSMLPFMPPLDKQFMQTVLK